MGRVAEVQCPKCEKKFIATIQMLNVSDVKFHCPWCDTYFKKSESPQIKK